MAFNDSISDLLTRIRNARSQLHRFVDIPISKVKMNILKVMQQQGFIENVILNEEKRKMRVFLKYAKGMNPVITGLKRISSPGLRRYVGHQEIPRVFGGLGIAILSTPHGIVDGETARQKKVGGELLCYIW